MERIPAVAGMFYPAASQELARTVKALIGPNPGYEKALAVVAPHAGYMYSGAIAGAVYGQVRVPAIAAVLCPNHTGMGTPASIVSSGTWQIPGHRVPIAQKLAEKLKLLALIDEDAVAHRREHSAEVHLPFLVERNPAVTLVPLCLGRLRFDRCREIGHALAEAVRDLAEEVLIVASTDMSHYLPAAFAEKQDRKALDRVEQLDAEGLYKTVLENDISMCGFIPTTIALVAAKELGATEAKLIRYGNSGEISGDFSNVVGYAGLVIR
jgi:AmmeMemoRadiSam system protein B